MQTLLAAESASGVAGVIEMAPYSTGPDWQKKILVSFERTCIEIALLAPLAAQRSSTVSVTECREDGQICYQPALPQVAAMRNQAMNFLQTLRGERTAPCDGQEAVKDLEVAQSYMELLAK